MHQVPTTVTRRNSLVSSKEELESAHFVGDHFDVHYLDGSKPMGVSGSTQAATSVGCNGLGSGAKP